MATDFTTSTKKVNRDFTNVVYKRYAQQVWGIEVGYNTVPDYVAFMNRSLLDWFKIQDCDNTLNAIANQAFVPPCPGSWIYVAATQTSGAYCSNGGCLPGYIPAGIDPVTGQILCQHCSPFAPCPSPTPIIPDNVLVTAPVQGANPFPSICKPRCEEKHHHHNNDKCFQPTALFIEFSNFL